MSAPIGANGEFRARSRHPKRQSLALRQPAQGRGHLFQHLLTVHHLAIYLQLARFNLGEVEQVVDQREQVRAARFDGLELPLLIDGKRSGELHQYRARESDDGVERRTEFMGHARQESVLGVVGVLELKVFLLKGMLEPFAFGHIAGGGKYALELAVAIVEGGRIIRHHGLGLILGSGGELVVGHRPLAEHQADALFSAKGSVKYILNGEPISSSRPRAVSAAIC